MQFLAPPKSIRGEVVQGILCGETVAVLTADLFENDYTLFIENEGRWIGCLVRTVPSQSIQVGDLIVRIRHKNNIGWQPGLLLEKLLGMLIEISGRSRVDQEHSRVLRFEF